MVTTEVVWSLLVLEVLYACLNNKVEMFIQDY